MWLSSREPTEVPANGHTSRRRVSTEQGRGGQVLRTQLLLRNVWQRLVPRGRRAKGPKSSLAVR